MLSLRNLKKTVWDISLMTREGKYLIYATSMKIVYLLCFKFIQNFCKISDLRLILEIKREEDTIIYNYFFDNINYKLHSKLISDIIGEQ